MIQKMSDQHKIHFLDDDSISKKDQTPEIIAQKTINQIAEEQKSKQLESKDNGLMTSHHISSARTGSIKDEGGPSKYVKSESSNTIWDNNKTEQESKKIDNKTKTLQEKSEIVSNKREAENKRMEDLTSALKSTLQDKASSVSPAGTLSGSNYKDLKNNMSIFDNKDFMRVIDKTAGEKVSEDISKRKSQIDNSWRNGGRSVSSKDITKNLFDGMFNKKQEK